MTTVIRADDLRKDFVLRTDKGRETLRAVAGVSFELRAGRCLGIVGESGSGKTTVARMLVGLEVPTSGTVEVRGELRKQGRLGARRRRTWARRAQMVFQDPYNSLDRRQTGRRCIEESLRLHFRLNTDERATRISRLAEQVGLTTEQMDLRPAQLSGGQRQRLAIARALAVEPDVLVLDESVSALDVSVQAQVLNCLSDIREELGTAFVFVSHDLGVIRQMADEVIVMKSGVVVERGETGPVLDSPQDPYTRLLKASVPGPTWRPPQVSIDL